MGQGPVLLTGAAGLLGHWLLRSAPDRANVVAVTHRRGVADVAVVAADLRDRAAVTAVVVDVRPSLVLHAAYAKDRASIVDATRHLVDAAAAVDTPVLFVSSDAVFAGDGVDRDEPSAPDATWDYGRWKAAAERSVIDGAAPGAVIRLPLLVSIDPDDHVVREIRAGAADGSSTRWFSDEMRRPALAAEVATAIWRIATLAADDRAGCWHLAGAERLSRFEIAQRVVARLHLPPGTIEPALSPGDGDRPRDIAFTAARARVAIGWDPSPVP